MKHPDKIKPICRGHLVAITNKCYHCVQVDWNDICKNYIPIPEEMTGLSQEEKFKLRYGEDYLQVMDGGMLR